MFNLFKLEEGTIATPWTAAPEDLIDTSIPYIEQTNTGTDT